MIPKPIARDDPALAALGLLLAVALVFGAGGVSAALGNLAVILVALAILAATPGRVRQFVTTAPRPVVCLVCASMALPALQLVPLPPGIWQALPGRDLVLQSLERAGGAGWFPLSVDSGRTLVALTGTIAPATIIAVGWTLEPARLVSLMRLAAVTGTAIAVFGALHFVNPEWGDLYTAIRPMSGIMVGTFADRNAAALVFVGCLALIAGLPYRGGSTAARWMWMGAAAILFVATILTRSRSGMVLLAAPVLLGGWRLAASGQRGEGRPSARRSPALPIAGALGAALAIAAVLASGQARTSVERFGGGDGMRAEMREDALFAARRYWPVGAGMGTFDEVFQIDESLEYVSPRKAGRAHMDYLELAIEAGVAGIALLAAWLVWGTVAGWRAVRHDGAWPARAGLAILLTIAAQSLLAFPLRSQAVLCFAALAIVALGRSPVGRLREGPGR